MKNSENRNHGRKYLLNVFKYETLTQKNTNRKKLKLNNRNQNRRNNIENANRQTQNSKLQNTTPTEKLKMENEINVHIIVRITNKYSRTTRRHLKHAKK